jgi:2-oxoglutarate/2-oxoacid ferredoxin oxidoreductase subunit beta
MSDSFTPDSYKVESKPVWCAGCGDFAVYKSMTMAFSELKLPKENIVLVSGIGCSSRIPGYFSTYGFNSVHGRALPIAGGLKFARPDLTVMAISGDGDGFSIGGGHILHTIRRNTPITYMVIDNNIYGLTKGQASPTTSQKHKMEKSLAGPYDMPINPMHIVFSYGAPFLARVNSTNIKMMTQVIQEALNYPGFSFIHCLASCITYMGSSFSQFIKKKSYSLEERGHNPTDHKAAYEIALNEQYAMGVIYKKVRE